MLTPKQEKFCQEYLVDLNASLAMKRAGYAEKNANVTGSRMLANVHVQARIQELRAKVAEKLNVTIEMVAKEYASIAFSKITDFVNVEQVSIWKGRGKNRKEIKVSTVVVKNTADIPPELIPAIAEIKATDAGISLKLHSKPDSLEALGKHLGFFLADNKQKQVNIHINGKKIAQKAE